MIKISPALLREVYDHTEESYPYECCGLLIGTTDGQTRVAHVFRKCRNLNTERAHDRYEMDPKGQLAVEKEARARGESILGIWHSHPDHPARPSQTDLDRAWPRYAYMIVAIQQGKASEWTTWELDDAEKAFRPVVVRVVQ